MLLAVLAVLVAMPAWVPRWQAERAHPGVELAVTDTALQLWQRGAVAAGHKRGSVYSQLNQAGVMTIVVGMHQLSEAVEAKEITPLSSAQIRRAGLAKKLPSHGKGVWIRSAYNDPSGTWGTLASMVTRRAKSVPHESAATVRVKTSKGWLGYLRWNTRIDVKSVPIGFDRARLAALRGANVPVILALPARSPSTAGWLRNELAAATSIADTKRLLLNGSLFTNARGVRSFANAITAKHYTVVMPDLYGGPSTLGDFSPYTDAAPGQVVRAHLIPFTRSGDADGLVARGRRAVKERGVRLVIAQPPAQRGATIPRLPSKAGLPQLDASTRVLSQWQHNMPTSPFADSPAPVTGKAAPLPVVDPGFLARGAALLGAFIVLAAAAFSLTEMRMLAFGKVRRLIARPLAAVGFCVASIACVVEWLLRLAWLNDAITLAVAIAAACWAVMVAMSGLAPPPRVNDRLPALRWIGFVGRFSAAVATMAAGGVVLGALGANSDDMISSTSFHGVKALLVTPVVVLAVVGFLSARAQLAESGDRLPLSPRLRWALIGLGVVLVGVFGAIYIIRSGNSGDATSQEVWLRNWLDDVLYVRPRFKEILFAFPALVLALRWPGAIGRWVCAAVAAVGAADVLDTFAHFHSPLSVELLRTGYAGVGGLVIGLVAAAILPYVLGPIHDGLRNLDRRAGLTDHGNEEPASL